MKKEYWGKLRCATCGSDLDFDFNEDKSFVKCLQCEREYPGGYDELYQLNSDAIEEVVQQINTEVEEEFEKILKGL